MVLFPITLNDFEHSLIGISWISGMYSDSI